MTAWVLVLFLMRPDGSGAVVVDMPNEESCQAALVRAKQMNSYEDGICLQR